MKHHLECSFCAATFEGSSPSVLKTLAPETEIWTSVWVSKVVQFVLLLSTSQGAEIE